MKLLELIKEATTKIFQRSSGPGGQNVNKRSTKVTLVFDIERSKLPKYKKDLLKQNFHDGIINVSNQQTRYQHRNLLFAFQTLGEKIRKFSTPAIPRKKTIPLYLTHKGKKRKKEHERLIKYRNRYLIDE